MTNDLSQTKKKDEEVRNETLRKLPRFDGQRGVFRCR